MLEGSVPFKPCNKTKDLQKENINHENHDVNTGSDQIKGKLKTKNNEPASGQNSCFVPSKSSFLTNQIYNDKATTSNNDAQQNNITDIWYEDVELSPGYTYNIMNVSKFI